jgi:hypothetical protein
MWISNNRGRYIYEPEGFADIEMRTETGDANRSTNKKIKKTDKY